MQRRVWGAWQGLLADRRVGVGAESGGDEELRWCHWQWTEYKERSEPAITCVTARGWKGAVWPEPVHSSRAVA